MDTTGIWQVYERLDLPVWVVTAAAEDRRGGLIATTAIQASIVPAIPRQLITINKRHHTHQLIEANGAFAMHLIDESQLNLVWRFGLQSGRDVSKLSGLSYRTGASGSPLLTDALAWFDCRVLQRMDTGDRSVYLAEVLDGRLERHEAPLTSQRLFALAPADKGKIMREQYDADAQRDFEAIQQWQLSHRGEKIER